MANETGDMKLLGNFRKLIDRVKNDPDYQPSNPALTAPAMETQYTGGLAAVQELATHLGANKVIVTERETGFDELRPLLTRVHNLVKASGAPPSVIEDLSTFKRKLSGTRKKTKAKAEPVEGATADGEAAAKQRSSAQSSYENQIGHLHGYLAVLEHVDGYDPREADLKLTALKALRDTLQSKNDAVSTAFVPVSQARGVRDELLYTGENSIVNTALMAKSYVSAAYGKSSQIYKDVAGLAFPRPRR
jgi:hypothetical protein